MKRITKLIIMTLMSLLFLIPVVNAAIPHLINYQGSLSDSTGSPIADGSYEITFSMYDHLTGGTQLWTETHPAIVSSNGTFSVYLGSVTPLEMSVFSDTSVYLEVIFSGEVLTPRSRLVSVPYAFNAGNINIDTINGGLVITPDEFTSIGNAITVLHENGQPSLTFSINSSGHALIDFYDPIDSKGGNRAATKVATLDKDGLLFFGATASDTNSQIFSNGDIITKGQITMGENSTGNTEWATVFGFSNSATGDSATISGGYSHISNGYAATISGGAQNTTGDGVNGHYATVGGGSNNNANETATVSGGRDNKANGGISVIGGGANHIADSPQSTISGGVNNTTNTGINQSIGGGSWNTASGNYATIGGGDHNSSSGWASVVGGGDENTSSGYASTIGGGDLNDATGNQATVSGGNRNQATNVLATIGGGTLNIANGNSSTISGGYTNNTSGNYSTIGGGQADTASGQWSTIGGGKLNNASGEYSTITGGHNNLTSGLGSLAGGMQAQARYNGSIVFCANNSVFEADTLTSGGIEQMVLGTKGGMYITNSYGTTATYDPTKLINTSSGAYLTTGGTWTNSSDENLKENFASVDNEEILEKISDMEIYEWNYKTEEKAIKHIGPTAQEFSNAFGLGNDTTSISTIDPSGVALVAIKALKDKYELLQQQLIKLQTENKLLKENLKEIENIKFILMEFTKENNNSKRK